MQRESGADTVAARSTAALEATMEGANVAAIASGWCLSRSARSKQKDAQEQEQEQEREK